MVSVYRVMCACLQTPIAPSIKYSHCGDHAERDSVHSVEGDGSITDSGRGPSEEGGDGRTASVAPPPPRDRYLPPPPPPPRGGAYWAQQQGPSHRAAHGSKTQSHPTVRFHGLSTMPEEDADDLHDEAVSSKSSPGRQLGRRAGGNRVPHHPSRVYHTPSTGQRRSDDSSYLLLQTDKTNSIQRPVAQHGLTADEPSTIGDDQRLLLQNGFVRDRERVYHDNSVIV